MTSLHENRPGPHLFVRMDRIGDLVMSLPADRILNSTRPDVTPASHADWWISPGLGFIADHAFPRRRAREVSRTISWSQFWTLRREVRSRGYKSAVIFYAPWWVSVLIFLARIPLRIGVRSQWHSYLFLNRGVRQNRSRSDVSELEYNLRLVEVGFGEQEGSLSRKELVLQTDSDWTSLTLQKSGLEPFGYVVVHPGMGQSALNWPTSSYAEWISKASQHFRIVITGSAADDAKLKGLKAELEAHDMDQGRSQRILWLNDELTGPMLLQVLAKAKAVLAPSTGVIHLAASVGAPVVGLYSPVTTQHPTRWGPVSESALVLMPQAQCPGKKRCIGTSCVHFDAQATGQDGQSCMRTISVESTLSAIRTAVKKSESQSQLKGPNPHTRKESYETA